MPANGRSTGRFELPQLKPINFSLTDGTNIPPPPDSPVEEKPPAPEPTISSAVPGTNSQSAATSADEVYDGRGRTNGNTAAVEQPTSPISTRRPSSIRRFLSRKSLNTNYTNGTNTNVSNEDVTMIDRPDSAMSFASARPSLPKNKSGSWFRRFSNSGTQAGADGSQSRTSIIYEDKQSVPKPKPMGPPPPKLPELSKLKARISDNDDGSLGAEDMFKNIK